MQELIGNTPLIEVKNIERKEDLKARVLVKVRPSPHCGNSS